MLFLCAFVVLLAAGLYNERLDWGRVIDFVVIVTVAGVLCTIVRWPPYAFFAFLTFVNALLILMIFGADIKLPPGAGRFLPP